MDDALPLTSIEDSELFGAFKAGKLRGPNAVAYDAKAWVDFTATISNPTMRDVDFLYAALHFGLEFESLRSLMEGKLPRLAPADAVDFVVAGLNVQTNTVISRTKLKLRKQARISEIAYMGDTGDIRVQNSGRQNLSPDDAMANFVDGMANILYRISETERNSSAADRDNALRVAQKISMFVSIEQGLKELWGRAAWEGYKIAKSGDCAIFTAGDEALAKLWLAWQRRFETIILQEDRLQAGEALARDDRTLRGTILARTVLRIEDRSGQKQEYIIGKARGGGDEQTLALGAVEATYLNSFLDKVLPKYHQTGLTYRDLWRAWWVLQDIAKIHQARMPSRGLRSWGQVGHCALRFSVSRAIRAIADALEISQSAAEVVMKIFTTDPDMANRKNASDLFQRGTWGRPVLRSRSEDRGRIVLASLMSPNPIMMMEFWMTRTGMIDDPKNRKNKTVRGKVFERVARQRLQTSGEKNGQLTEFGVASLPARGEGTEEIDALLSIGSTIAVCEMKCLNVPFGSIDYYNHLGKIEEAADQVIRKTVWSRAHPASILDALSVPEDERGRAWQFMPIVVLSTAYGAGLTLNGCAITDLDWLSTFLGSSQIVVGGTFERGRGASIRSQAVYRDQADLERRLLDIAVSPPSLAFELCRIEWEMVPFPTRSGEPFRLRIPVSKGMPDLPTAI